MMCSLTPVPECHDGSCLEIAPTSAQRSDEEEDMFSDSENDDDQYAFESDEETRRRVQALQRAQAEQAVTAAQRPPEPPAAFGGEPEALTTWLLRPSAGLPTSRPLDARAAVSSHTGLRLQRAHDVDSGAASTAGFAAGFLDRAAARDETTRVRRNRPGGAAAAAAADQAELQQLGAPPDGTSRQQKLQYQ